MSYLVDTCVVSEMVRPEPSPSVLSWLDSQEESRLYLSVLTLGELTRGVEKLPNSARRTRLRSWLHHELRERFHGRWLGVTEEICLTWGQIQARTEAQGLKLPAIDSLLAASAITHNLIMVTRNIQDFERAGVLCLDPWQL